MNNISIPINMYNLEPVQAIICLLKRVVEDERMPEDLRHETTTQLEDILNNALNNTNNTVSR